MPVAKAPAVAWLNASTPLLTTLPPEMVLLAPCRVAPALMVVEPVQLLAVLVRTIVPDPPITTGCTASPPPRVIEPVRVATTPASVLKVLGSALAGATTDRTMLLA